MRKFTSRKGKLLNIFFLTALCILFNIVISGQKQQKPIEFLKPYTKCNFSDDLRIVRVDKMVSNKNTPRAVKTATGDKEVSRLASYRVMIKYPKHDHFMANVRPEISADGKYDQDKQNVVESLKNAVLLDKELSSPDGMLKVELNGFEIYHYNRRDFFFDSQKSKSNPMGGVGSIGQAVIFSDADKTITTVYFFNTKIPRKNPVGFNSIEEWIDARDKFFNSYTACIVNNRKN